MAWTRSPSSPSSWSWLRWRWRRLRLEDVGRLTVSVDRVRAFLTADGWRPTMLADRLDLRPTLRPPVKQLDLFAA